LAKKLAFLTQNNAKFDHLREKANFFRRKLAKIKENLLGKKLLKIITSVHFYT
jgi:hypothetical protein